MLRKKWIKYSQQFQSTQVVSLCDPIISIEPMVDRAQIVSLSVEVQHVNNRILHLPV